MRDILKDPGWVEGQPGDYTSSEALVQRRDERQHKQAHNEHAFKFELDELGVLALKVGLGHRDFLLLRFLLVGALDPRVVQELFLLSHKLVCRI